MSLRVLHILSHSSFKRGGAIQALRMAKALSFRGITGTLILNNVKPVNYPVPKGFSVLCLPLNLCNLTGFVKISLAHTVIHLHRQESLFVGALSGLISGRPVVFQRGTTYRLKRPYLLCVKLLCSRVVAVSVAVKRSLVLNGIYEDKIKLIYGSAEFPASNLKRKRNFISVGIVAALVGKKGYPLFFSIANLMCKYIRNVKFLIFGDGRIEKYRDYYSEIEESVHFKGYVKDPDNIYPLLDFLVCTSLKGEGLTGSLREAMLYKVPVASTPVSGNPEFVEHLKTGIVIPFEFKFAAEKIIETLLIPKLMSKFVCNAYKKASIYFNISVHGKKLNDLYREVIR